MHPYTTHQIAEVVGGVIRPSYAADLRVAQITHDSRRIPRTPDQLFVALHGPRHDGHVYAAAAYESGIRAFLVDREQNYEDFPEATFILVQETNQALQTWATFHRGRFTLPIIGITGSNGKTTVKEWLFQLLEEDYRIVRSPASYNSQVGVPLSILQINPQDQLGIFEAGISEVDEMKKLAPIIDCNIGLFTNIGTAHAAGFSNRKEKIREKLKLFTGADILIYCKDHDLISQAVQGANLTTFSWSRQGSADLSILEIHTDRRYTEVKARYQSQSIEIEIPFIDQASIENAIHCWAILLHLGVAPGRISQRMKGLKRLELRLALRAGINHCTLIDDTYNADLTSLKNALRFLDQQPKHLPRTVILSDLLQSGLAPKDLYQQIADLMQAAKVEKVIGIGQKVSLLADFLASRVETYFFRDTLTFLREDLTRYFSNEIILLKGARAFAFDRISQALSAQQHRTVLEVNMEAISANLLAFQQCLQPATKVMVMVKAAAYGIGSLQVARHLAYLGVDYLAVAYVDEGVKLRQGGISLPILVLNPEPSAFANLFRYELEPEVYTLDQLKDLYDYAELEKEDLKIHLKLDTGMSRLGFAEEALEDLLEYLKEHPQIKINSVFSHLAASEDPQEDRFTERQVQVFHQGYARIATALGYRPIRHILNSAGIARFPQHQMEMVRLGIGLYGILGEKNQLPLQVVLRLKAAVSQLKWLEPGDTVGYGRFGNITRRTRLATISIGYADGLPRQIDSDVYQLRIHGQPAPILGNVCMDMCMVDVTDIPEVQYKDEVIVFGEVPKIEDLARASDRIVYEILTAISTRVQRLYTS